MARVLPALLMSFPPNRAQAWLSAEEFKKLFGSTKAEFYAAPKWKRTDKKKRLGLF